nr:hypothetical protein BaRGS_024858 [Batillaria attramentaria]
MPCRVASGTVCHVASGTVCRVASGTVCRVASGTVCRVASGTVCRVASGTVCRVASGTVCRVASGTVCRVASGTVCYVASGTVCRVASGTVCHVASGTVCPSAGLKALSMNNGLLVREVRVMKCPSRLAWDPYRVACVYMYPATGHIVSNPSITPSWAWQFTNPCTPRQLAGNHHYFAHPDPTRFIQCDNAGQAFVVSCPSGLVWNQYSETCLSKFSNVVVA